MAVISRDASAVQELLKAGANPDGALEDGDGSTALHTACELGDRPTVEILLAHDADVSAATGKGYTPLHGAAAGGYEEIARLLIKHGADPLADPAGNGISPTAIALRRGRPGIALYLLREGRAADLASDSLNELLVLASSLDSLDLVTFLADYGADVNARIEMGPDVRAPHETSVSAMFEHDGERFHHFLPSPMQQAVWAGRGDIVRFLADKGASIDPIDSFEFPPLILAARKGDVAIGKVLLDGGADPDAAGANGSTALHVSVRFGHFAFAVLLAERGANTTVQDIEGKTPLMYLNYDRSVSMGQGIGDRDKRMRNRIDGVSEMLGTLIDAGFDPNAPGANGNTPVHNLVRGNNVRLLEPFFDHGADHSVRNDDGETPLTSIMYEDTGIDGIDWRMYTAKVLLERGADPNVTNNNGSAPLHLAADARR